MIVTSHSTPKKLILTWAIGILAIMPQIATADKIVIANDEWQTTNLGFAQTPVGSARFVLNIAQWFSGSPSTGKFLVYSNNFSLDPSLATTLRTTMTGAGYTWTAHTSIPGFTFDLATLLQYDGVFFALPPSANLAVLTDYVNAGGNVYIAGGTGALGTAFSEALAWNHFLKTFGLQFNAISFNGISGNIPIQNPLGHPVLNGVGSLYQNNGNSVSTYGSNPNAKVIETLGTQGLYAVYHNNCVMPGSLKLTNYQVVSQQLVNGGQSYVTYRADLVNPGIALGPVTAALTSLDPFTIRVVPNQGTLIFTPVPANSQVTSSNTFTILTDAGVPLDFSKLHWTFQIADAVPVANPGPNQTVPAGTTVTLDGSGSTNLGCGGTLTYSWRFTSRPPGSNTRSFYSTGAIASFLADVPGNYVITLTVSNGVFFVSRSVTVTAQ